MNALRLLQFVYTSLVRIFLHLDHCRATTELARRQHVPPLFNLLQHFTPLVPRRPHGYVSGSAPSRQRLPPGMMVCQQVRCSSPCRRSCHPASSQPPKTQHAAASTAHPVLLGLVVSRHSRRPIARGLSCTGRQATNRSSRLISAEYISPYSRRSTPSATAVDLLRVHISSIVPRWCVTL